MADIAGEIFIRRPVDEVFDFVADERNEPLYNPKLSSVEQISDGPIGSGTQFRASTRSIGRAAKMVIEFTDYERPSRLASSTQLAAMDIHGDLRFDAIAGGTRMRWFWDIRPHGLLKLASPVIGRLGRRQEQAIWTGLKRHLEGGEGPAPKVRPLPFGTAARAQVRCAVVTASLLARRRLHLPREHVGMRLRYADGTSARVYRETVVDRPAPAEPCVLVVGFRLRRVRGRGHAIFRWESMLNTMLFAGFPGLVSKLWFAHDDHGLYRGLYEWDGPQLAEDYARALWWVLALVSVRGSISYRVLPGLRRDELLRDPTVLAATTPDWWRVVAVE